jgi:hypothetical protein
MLFQMRFLKKYGQKCFLAYNRLPEKCIAGPVLTSRYQNSCILCVRLINNKFNLNEILLESYQTYK